MFRKNFADFKNVGWVLDPRSHLRFIGIARRPGVNPNDPFLQEWLKSFMPPEGRA